MHPLGIFGPWQIIFLLLILGLAIGLPLALIASRSKHKARADVLDEVRKTEREAPKDILDQLERLQKLREAGALTEEEFETQKKKLL